LPRGDDGYAMCSKAFYEAVAALPNVKWGKLPRHVTAFSKGDAGSKQRYVHAKVYRLFSPAARKELLLVGSPNLTNAAHRGAKRGNLESAMLLDVAPSSKPDWWLEADTEAPLGFHHSHPEDQPLDAVLPVTLSFDWKAGALSYFWEMRKAGNPEAFSVSSGGEPLARVEPVVLGEWSTIDAQADVLRERLRPGSFLEVGVGDGPPQRVLVQETGMEEKPALVLDLSPEQILEFWSMLTTEQQDAFLEREILRLIAKEEGNTTQSAKSDDVISLFDRFAGIFHAFSCLRERIDEALRRQDASGERHAVYRLFGVRYDSLRALVDAVLDAKEGDQVNRYVSLLCAREVVQWVRKRHPKFADEYADDLDRLEDRLSAIDNLREAFTFDTEKERAGFFEWFDEMFQRPVRVPKARA
jgi:hypothetical protein